MTKHLPPAAFALLLAAPTVMLGQGGSANKAIDLNPAMPLSNSVVAGNTLYVAGQQGLDRAGKLDGVRIEDQTANTIAAIQKVVEKAGFKMTDLVNVTDLADVPKMNEVYKKLMPNPQARARHGEGRRPDRLGKDRDRRHRREAVERKRASEPQTIARFFGSLPSAKQCMILSNFYITVWRGASGSLF